MFLSFTEFMLLFVYLVLFCEISIKLIIKHEQQWKKWPYWDKRRLHLYHKDQVRMTRKKNQTRISRRKRIRQKVKKTRILPGESILASSAKTLSTRILPECHDQFFSDKNLVCSNVNRILADQPRKTRISQERWQERWQERRLVSYKE